MAKVIVERPRHGSRLATKGKGYDRRGVRLGWENQPKREGMKVRGGGQKSFNEHLGPLRRYLAGQVGRPWSKIFADICRHLDRGSVVQNHVRGHVDDYVAVRVIVQGGQLCHGDGYSIGRPLRSLYYVCPRSGIMKKNPRPRRWYFSQVEKVTLHQLGDRAALVRHAGAWHVITTRTIPEQLWFPDGRLANGHLPRWDELLKTKLYRDQAQRIYGRPIHAVAARRASKREARQFVNSYPCTNLAR